MSDAHRFNPYIAHGWKLCTIEPGSKGPKYAGWNTQERAVRAPSEWPLGFGAGLCHAWSGTCALDIDNMEVADAWLLERGVNLHELLAARDSVQISSGRPGRAKLLYRLPEALASLKDAPYVQLDPVSGKPKTYHGFELRCATESGTTVQDVLPPSIHKDTGRPYEWRYGDDLTGHWSMLPPIPPALHALWLSMLDAKPTPATDAGPVAAAGAEHAELAALLDGEDPDTDYETWVKVGMAIHHETRGSQQGLALWDAWSRKGSKYGSGNPPQFPRDKWGSFQWDEASAVTVGWLRSRQVAALDAFPVVPASTTPTGEFAGAPAEDYGTDTRPDAMMQRAVGDHVVYVREIGKYFDLRSRQVYMTEDGLRHAFNPDVPLIVLPGRDGKGDKTSRPDPYKWLMNSAERRARDVRAIGMHPGEGVIFEHNGSRYANGFRQRAPVESLAPTAFERDAFRFIWSRLLDARFADWLMKFFAHALKYPGVKMQTAPLLISETTGTGKSTLMAEIPRLLFGDVLQMTESDIKSPYNGQLVNAWWVTFEEVCAGNTKTERRYITDRIKPWITNPEISVRPMFMSAFTIPNRLQFTASSNHPDALQLDDEDERRWGVCAVREESYTPAQQVDVYQGFLNTPRAAGVLKHIFERVDLTGFSPTAKAPTTIAKKDMVELGRGSWETAIVERMESRMQPFDKDCFTVEDVQSLVFGSKGGPSRVHLGRMLNRSPLNCVLLPRFTGTRVYAWRNKEAWALCTHGERMTYLETGVRPEGTWPDDAPVLESGSPHSDLV